MIGPTGVGKTEIARRLAGLVLSPFLKVEASKFTEVGYVGRDVESMVRDLLELAINMVREEERAKVTEKAGHLAEERLLDILVPPLPARRESGGEAPPAGSDATREKFRRMLREGKLAEREVELEVEQARPGPMFDILGGSGMESMESNFREMFGKMFPRQSRRQRLKVPEALAALGKEEAEKLIDTESVTRLAIERTEQSGIIFLDEIDKIASRSGGHGPEVSREGVQRDLLPIVEGSTVSTKHGLVRTDHILFMAGGAFHVSKPSDLIPELQGRFPIRVELAALSEDDFYRILTEPQNALLKQYVALLATEGVELHFSDEAVRELARIAAEVNGRTENIGARRLHTVLERLLETLSFEAPEQAGSRFEVDAAYVRRQLAEVVADEDLSRFIL